MTASHGPNEPHRLDRFDSDPGFRSIQEQTAAGAQGLRDAGVLAAMEALDPELTEGKDGILARELKIKELAESMAANTGRSFEETEAIVRGMYEKHEQKLAENIKARYEKDADYLTAFGQRVTASLQGHAGAKPNNSHAEKTGGAFGRFKQSKLGKWAVGGMVALGLASGGVAAANKIHEVNQAKFEATQSQIAPIIAGAMIDIDKQTLDQQRTHPEELVVTPNPNGYLNATRFVSIAGNARIIMGNTDGKPDPSKPLYIDYRNNMGTGEGTNGIRILMTSPEGNKWVDESPVSEFGGTTDGGWAASGPGADTTDRGYAGTSKPAPLEAAQDVAKAAQELENLDQVHRTKNLPAAVL